MVGRQGRQAIIGTFQIKPIKKSKNFLAIFAKWLLRSYFSRTYGIGSVLKIYGILILGAGHVQSLILRDPL